MNNSKKIMLILMVLLSVILIPVEVSAGVTTTTNNGENSGNTLTLSADNKYFPNMTLTEIKKWYLDECAKFIATGKSNGCDLEYYKQGVELWSKWSFNEKKNQMESAYAARVEAYNTTDTQDFYKVQKKIYDFIKDYHTNNEYMLNFSNWDKVNELSTETTTTNSTENSGNTLTLPADNKYFPNMTLTEIKKWYLDECNKFVATGKKSAGNQFYDVEYFKQCVENYSEYSFNKKEKRMLSMYMTIVDGYNKSDTQEFYQVQKKLYDFIKDYHANNEYMLNFSNWDKVNQLPTEAPSSSEESTQTPTQQVTEPTAESTETSTVANNDEGDKTSPNIIIIAVPIIVLLIITTVAIFLWKRRTTNK